MANIGIGVNDANLRPTDGYVVGYVPTATTDTQLVTNNWRFGLPPAYNDSLLAKQGYARCDMVKNGYIPGISSAYGNVSAGLAIDISRPDWHPSVPEDNFTAIPPTQYNIDGSTPNGSPMATDQWRNLRISWGGVHPYALRTAIFIWNVPVVLLNPARIQSAIKDNPVLSVSVNGRYMYVSFEKPAAIDGAGGLGVAIGAGAVGHRCMNYVSDAVDPVSITSPAGAKTTSVSPPVADAYAYTGKIGGTPKVDLQAPDNLFLGGRQMHVYGLPTQGVLQPTTDAGGVTTYAKRPARIFYTAIMVCNGDFLAGATCVWPMVMVPCTWQMFQDSLTPAPAWAVSLRVSGTTTSQFTPSLSQRIYFLPSQVHIESATLFTDRTITATTKQFRSDWIRPTTETAGTPNQFRSQRIGFICTVLGVLDTATIRNTQVQHDTVSVSIGANAAGLTITSGPERTAVVENFIEASPGEDVWVQFQGLAGPKIRLKLKLVDKPAVPGQLGWYKMWTATPNISTEDGSPGVWVELASALSGGASTPTPTMIGIVLGGNANPIRPPTGKQGTENYTVPSTAANTEPDELNYTDADYPVTRPYAFPLPAQSRDNTLKVLPRVNRWDRYELSTNYRFGDKLPRLPDGLCWVRLTRPYEWGGKSWKANIDLPESITPGVSTPVKATVKDGVLTVKFSDGSEGWRKYDTTAGNSKDIPPGQAFKLITRLLDTNNQLIKVDDYSISKGVVTLKLSAAIDVMDLVGSQIVIADQVFVKDNSGAATGPGLLFSEAGKLTIQAGGDFGTVVIAVNRSGLQGFVQGDYVIMQDTQTVITDGRTDAPESKAVLTVLGSAGGQVPLHTHTNNGGGLAGGGLANFSSLT